MTNKERLEERAREEENLNRDYRTLLGDGEASLESMERARSRIRKDFDAILHAKTWFPDMDGHYCPYRAAIEEGGRKIIRDLLNRINSKSKGDGADEKPKVIPA